MPRDLRAIACQLGGIRNDATKRDKIRAEVVVFVFTLCRDIRHRLTQLWICVGASLIRNASVLCLLCLGASDPGVKVKLESDQLQFTLGD